MKIMQRLLDNFIFGALVGAGIGFVCGVFIVVIGLIFVSFAYMFYSAITGAPYDFDISNPPFIPRIIEGFMAVFFLGGSIIGYFISSKNLKNSHLEINRDS